MLPGGPREKSPGLHGLECWAHCLDRPEIYLLCWRVSWAVSEEGHSVTTVGHWGPWWWYIILQALITFCITRTLRRFRQTIQVYIELGESLLGAHKQLTCSTLTSLSRQHNWENTLRVAPTKPITGSLLITRQWPAISPGLLCPLEPWGARLLTSSHAKLFSSSTVLQCSSLLWSETIGVFKIEDYFTF